MGRFKGKITVVTGGAHGIGKAIADGFRGEGAAVHIIDIKPGDWFVGDVGNKDTLERFAEYVIQQSGHVDYLINMVVKSLITQLQNRFRVSAAELDEQDTHQSIVIGVAAIVPHNAIADSLMEKISQFVESASEAEVWEETREIR